MRMQSENYELIFYSSSLNYAFASFQCRSIHFNVKYNIYNFRPQYLNCIYLNDWWCLVCDKCEETLAWIYYLRNERRRWERVEDLIGNSAKIMIKTNINTTCIWSSTFPTQPGKHKCKFKDSSQRPANRPHRKWCVPKIYVLVSKLYRNEVYLFIVFIAILHVWYVCRGFDASFVCSSRQWQLVLSMEFQP